MIDEWGNWRLNDYSSPFNQSLAGIKVLILVGSGKVSGGTNMIFHYAHALEQRGASVTCALLHGSEKDTIWHPLASGLTFSPWAKVSRSGWDLAIATWWPTVFELADVEASSYLYFVQSLESRFGRNSVDRTAEALAGATYLIGLPTIVVASWLMGFMSSVSSAPIALVRNGLDKSLWTVEGPRLAERNPRNPRVLIEGMPGVAMKAVDETLQVCLEAGAIDVWHVSPGKALRKGVTRGFSSVPMSSMPEIYRSVDVLVKLSRVEGMFGPPLEAFHCGATAIVSEVTGFDEYIENGINSISVPVDDFATATTALEYLLKEADAIESLQKGAIETATNWPSIEESRRQFVSVCVGLLQRENGQDVDWGVLKEMKAEIEAAGKAGNDPLETIPSQFSSF